MLWVQLFFKTGFWSKISGFQFKRGSCDHRGAPVTSDRWSIGGAPITSPKVTGAPKNLGLTTRRSHLLRRWRYQHRAEVTRAAPPKFATCSNFIPTVFRTFPSDVAGALLPASGRPERELPRRQRLSDVIRSQRHVEGRGQSAHR